MRDSTSIYLRHFQAFCLGSVSIKVPVESYWSPPSSRGLATVRFLQSLSFLQTLFAINSPPAICSRLSSADQVSTQSSIPSHPCVIRVLNPNHFHGCSARRTCISIILSSPTNKRSFRVDI